METSKNKSTFTMATQPNKFNTCCQFLINVIVCIFFAIYAFNNPDGDADCYTYHVDLNDELVASEVKPKSGEYTDVSKAYFIIFVTYFCLCIVNLMYTAVATYYLLYDSRNMRMCASGLVCVSGSLSLAWMIYASIVVFGEDGKACDDAGIAEKSYMFIYVWLIIMYTGLGLLCCCSFMLLCIIRSNKNKKNREAHGDLGNNML